MLLPRQEQVWYLALQDGPIPHMPVYPKYMDAVTALEQLSDDARIGVCIQSRIRPYTPPPREGWDEWYIGVAKKWSERSKDPSTQCGCVIVRPDKTEAATGYNGFPRRIADKVELLANREEKYKRVVHAEMNALQNAREQVDGYTLYVWPFLSCERCTVHIIQAGIARVVAATDVDKASYERWRGSLELSQQLYKEAGVEVTLL